MIDKVAHEADVRAELEVSSMVLTELNGNDPLSEQLRVLAPDGKIEANMLWLCKNCGKIAHKKDTCDAPEAPREFVKKMTLLCNLHRKLNAMTDGKYKPYWLI